MIIEGNPELGLQKHQQEAYKTVQKAYESGNKSSVVMPTGCGKSFISLQLMVDNKDKRILFMAPTNAIKNQMYNYIAKYIVGEEPTGERTARMISNEYFPNLKIILYPSLLRIRDEQMEKLNADIIIMDELHRTGADKWGEKINILLEKNPNAKVLGLTATPDRMDEKNVVDELFEGNINYELTLVEAIRERIVKPPIYVKCDYALGEYAEGIREAISNCKNELIKKELQDKYDKMRKIVEQADGIPELLAKNIKKKDGKYIIFCKDKEHMDELISKAKKWFEAIDTEPEIYSVFSGEGYTEKANRKTIENFKNSKSRHIKLLYSIEMLNEGVHIEDISGVIMARPTDSRIIYLQQLGRILSSDTSTDKTIVFDLVNNYLKNNLDAEINEKKDNKITNVECSNTGINGKDVTTSTEDIDIFRIQGETLEFLDILNEVKEIIDRRDFLTRTRAIKEWIEKSGGTKPPSAKSQDIEEKKLGIALRSIRSRLIKPYECLETEEEKNEFRKKYPDIDKIMEIIKEVDENNISTYLLNARAIKEWIEKSGGTKPPASTSKNIEENRLGKDLLIIRRLIKTYKCLETEGEKNEFRKKYPEIDEIMRIVKEIDESNISTYLINARAIKEWIEKSGGTKPPYSRSQDIEEKRLGIALIHIRKRLIKLYKNLETEEEKNEFRKKHPEIDEVMEIIKEIDEKNISVYLLNARAIKEWIERSGKTKPPSPTSKDVEEKKLGTNLIYIRKLLIKPYMCLETEGKKEKFREKHPEIDDVLYIVSELEVQYGNKKQKELKRLIKQDLEKRKILQEAKKLEKEYEHQLTIKREKISVNNQEQGVNFNEQ